jgi:hypothetical protein
MEFKNSRYQDSVRTWLEGRINEDAIAIAFFSSARVLPLFASKMEEDWAHKRHVSPLPIFRALITVGVAQKKPSKEIKDASRAASSSALYLGRAVPGYGEKSVVRASSNSARAAAAALPHHCKEAAALAVRTAVDAFLGVWDYVDNDMVALETGHDIFDQPLWLGKPPSLIDISDAQARLIWAKNPQTWDFWVRWWDGVIAGKPLDWELQKQVALIPDDDWQKGPEHIASLIRQIEARFAQNETDIPKAPKPESALYLTQNRLVARMQAQGLAGQIVDVIERYARDTGCNDLPDEFQALRSMPTVLLQLGHKLADASTTEDALRAEVQRLNARVLRLEADLREAKARNLTGTFSESFKKQAAKSLGDWKMWGALVGGVSVLGGVLAMVDAAQSIAESVQGIFGDQLPESGEPLPELQDKALPDLPALPRLTDV